MLLDAYGRPLSPSSPPHQASEPIADEARDDAPPNEPVIRETPLPSTASSNTKHKRADATAWWKKPIDAANVLTFGLLILNIFLLRATKDAADTARSASNTAANALAASVEQFRTDERAWIEIEPPNPILKVPASTTYGGALYTYDFFLTNVGKTAAFNIAVRAPRAAIDAGLLFGDDADQITRSQERLTKHFFGSKLAPSDEVILLSERNSKTLGPGVKAFSPFQLYGQEPRFERYRFLIGRIDYTDAFSVSHWNTFCFFVDTGGFLRYCREGNDEDRNPEIQPEQKR